MVVKYFWASKLPQYSDGRVHRTGFWWDIFSCDG